MGNTTSCDHAEVHLLLTAIIEGDLECASRLLLKNPALLTAPLDRAQGNPGEPGHNAMHMAVILGKHSILSYLLSFSRIGGSAAPMRHAGIPRLARSAMNCCRDLDGATPLMLACDLGDAESVRLLLSARADTWRRDKQYKRTCLHYAAAKGHAAIIRMVIENSDSGISNEHPRPLVDACTTSGFTPLMYAAWFNHAEVVRVLAALGAKIRRRTMQYSQLEDTYITVAPGSTALHVAAANASEQAALAIVLAYVGSLSAQQRREPPIRGADVRTLASHEGRTAFSLARHLRHRSMLPVLNPMTDWESFLPGHQGNASRAAPPSQPLMSIDSLRSIAGRVLRASLIQRVQELSRDIQEGAGATKLLASRQGSGMPRQSSLRLRSWLEQPSEDTCLEEALPSAGAGGGGGSGGWDSGLGPPRLSGEGRGQIQVRGAAPIVSGAGGGGETSRGGSAPAALGVTADPADPVDPVDPADPNGVAATAVISAADKAVVAAGAAAADFEAQPAMGRQLGNSEDVQQLPGHSVRGGRAAAAAAAPVLADCEGQLELKGVSSEPDHVRRSLLTEAAHSKSVKEAAAFVSLPSRLSGERLLLGQGLVSKTLADSGSSGRRQYDLARRARTFSHVHVSPSAAEVGQTATVGVTSHGQTLAAKQGAAGPAGPSDCEASRIRSPINLGRRSLGLALRSPGAQAVLERRYRTSLVQHGQERVQEALLGRGSVGKREHAGPEASSSLSAQTLPRAASLPNCQEAWEAIASLAEVATEQQLADTLAACRLHRLVHGVSGTLVGTPDSTPGGTMRAARSALEALEEADMMHGTRTPLPTHVLVSAGSRSLSAAGAAAAEHMVDPHANSGCADDDVTCAVCLDDGDFIAIQACGHKICVDCAVELLRMHPADVVPCPFCRGDITGFGLVPP